MILVLRRTSNNKISKSGNLCKFIKHARELEFHKLIEKRYFRATRSNTVIYCTLTIHRVKYIIKTNFGIRQVQIRYRNFSFLRSLMSFSLLKKKVPRRSHSARSSAQIPTNLVG